VTGVLTLRSNRKSKVEDKNHHFGEQRYGRFERHIPLAVAVDRDQVNAAFKNGAQSVTLLSLCRRCHRRSSNRNALRSPAADATPVAAGAPPTSRESPRDL
jgi:cytochrome c553